MLVVASSVGVLHRVHGNTADLRGGTIQGVHRVRKEMGREGASYFIPIHHRTEVEGGYFRSSPELRQDYASPSGK